MGGQLSLPKKTCWCSENDRSACSKMNRRGFPNKGNQQLHGFLGVKSHFSFSACLAPASFRRIEFQKRPFKQICFSPLKNKGRKDKNHQQKTHTPFCFSLEPIARPKSHLTCTRDLRTRDLRRTRGPEAQGPRGPGARPWGPGPAANPCAADGRVHHRDVLRQLRLPEKENLWGAVGRKKGVRRSVPSHELSMSWF